MPRVVGITEAGRRKKDGQDGTIQRHLTLDEFVRLCMDPVDSVFQTIHDESGSRGYVSNWDQPGSHSAGQVTVRRSRLLTAIPAWWARSKWSANQMLALFQRLQFRRGQSRHRQSVTDILAG